MSLTLLKGEGTNSSRSWSKEVIAALVSCLAASRELELRLNVMITHVTNMGRERARLHVMAAFCRAHASRVRARLNAAGCKLAAVAEGTLVEGVESLSFDEQVLAFKRQAYATSTMYEQKADLARLHSDLSTAWVCDLNKTESHDLATEITTLFKSNG